MPPKARFTKQQIIEAGLDIVRKEGPEGLTARALGRMLGSTACPIFTVYASMDEIRADVIAAAKALYGEYVERGLKSELPFKGVGAQYIAFAVGEPVLFRLLFMSEQPEAPQLDNVLPIIDENYGKILASVRTAYGLSADESELLYRHLWIYTHGIATLCATKMCTFTPDEISRLMTQAFRSVLSDIKTQGGAQ